MKESRGLREEERKQDSAILCDESESKEYFKLWGVEDYTQQFSNVK